MSLFKRKSVSWQIQLDRVLRTAEQSQKILKHRRKKEIIPIQKLGLTSKNHQRVILWALITQRIYEYCHIKKRTLLKENLREHDFCFYSSFYLGKRRKQFFLHTWLMKKKIFRKRRYAKSEHPRLKKLHRLIQKANYKIF